ncbi:MAG TPA: IS200/IS605 family transposase [Ktedonobacterales bacterium]|nr:IS200/IS605 family transposase [Ktedonobacterales bacterium]
MRRIQNAIFVRLIWATWDRLPLLVTAIERDVHRAIEAKRKELGTEIIAFGGVEDHVHLPVRLPATLTVADLVKHLKGVSSHLLTQRLHPYDFFKWQGAYAAYSVSVDHLDRVSHYIAHQREHHANNTFVPDWEIPLGPRNERGGEEKPA